MSARQRPVAVTGATGHVGGRIARRLAAAGVPQRLVVRDLSRAPRLDGAEPVQASFSDTGALAAALAGIETVFMVSAAETADRVSVHTTFVDVAAAAGVVAIVYLSFARAAPDATFTLARDHWATEEHIRRAGLRFTFLRDNIYADFMPLMVGEDAVIRGPAGNGRVAAVAQDDVADVAAAVLLQPRDHDGATYELTGPEALSLHEVAAMLSQSTGRTISYHNETVEEAYTSRARYGAPQWQVDAWVSTYLAVASGELAAVSDDVQRVCGHPARALAQVLSG
ncbi:MAG: NAD-dependent epimerase/dehydratase family protein [Chloroflexi bacterium]|nr:MAG: NAD-dependent epimerase/dehydratase family protein [Chloroflexota bacterium]